MVESVEFGIGWGESGGAGGIGKGAEEGSAGTAAAGWTNLMSCSTEILCSVGQ